MGLSFGKEGEAPVPTAVGQSIVSGKSGSKLATAELIGQVDDSCAVKRVKDVGKHLTWDKIIKLLNTTDAPIQMRYRALTLAYDKAPSKIALVRAMEDALKVQTESLLLRHEIAYMIGQAGIKPALDGLRALLCDESEDVIVRHEAAEALWAVCCLTDGKHEAIKDIKQFVNHSSRPLAHTCQLVLEGMIAEVDSDSDSSSDDEDTKKRAKKSSAVPVCACQSKFDSQDPADGIPDATPAMIPHLARTLSDSKQALLERYRAMFTLRNLGGEKAVKSLCTALEADQSSAIMRHEIAFVLGQMASTDSKSPLAIPALVRMLACPREHGMVRHEAALALGCLGTWDIASFKKVTLTLKKYSKDSDLLVAESCLCALDDLTAPIDWVGKDGW